MCFEIHGPGEHETSRSVSGADSVQALVLTPANIPLDLSLAAHEMGEMIKFLGRKDLEFTISPPQ